MGFRYVTGAGWTYPDIAPFNYNYGAGSAGYNLGQGTLDATGEAYHFTGSLFVPDDQDSTSSHTISAAGSGKITTYFVTVTLADGSSELRLGLQDADMAHSDGYAHGDGTFDVYKSYTSAAPPATGFVTHTMSSGSKTLAHGDIFSFVVEMTARGGSDVIRPIQYALLQSSSTNRFPCGTQYLSSAWGNYNFFTSLVIEFDDGYLGCMYGMPPIVGTSEATLTASSTPDEIGLIFQAPMRVLVNAIWCVAQQTSDATSDYELILYADPLGTPTALATISVPAELSPYTITTSAPKIFAIDPVVLEPNTDYCVAVKATGTGNVRNTGQGVNDANWRRFLSGGTTLRRGERSDGSGAFGSLSTTAFPLCGVAISAVDVAPMSGFHLGV